MHRGARGPILVVIGSLILATVLISITASLVNLDTDQVVFGLFILSGIAANIYFPLYTTRRWWESDAGIALWMKSLGNMLLIDMILLTLIFGEDFAARPYIRIFAMTVFAAGLWYLLIALLRSPKEQKSKRHRQPVYD